MPEGDGALLEQSDEGLYHATVELRADTRRSSSIASREETGRRYESRDVITS